MLRFAPFVLAVLAAPRRRASRGSSSPCCSRCSSPSASTTSSSASTASCATTRCSGTCGSLLEALRPELQQYFIERNTDGRPYDRDTRTSIYERAKGIKDEQAYGTERDVNEPGYEWLLHSTAPLEPPSDLPRVRIGGPDCTQPYDMALLNVSAMSFGALSGAALRALNAGAAGRRLRPRHRRGRPDEVPPGERRRPDLGARQRLLRRAHQGRRLRRRRVPRQGRARPASSASRSSSARAPSPASAACCRASKVTKEIAEARDVPQGQTCVSPAAHKVFSTPRELVRFIARMRELARRQAGRLQAVRRLAARAAGDLQGDARRRGSRPTSSSSTAPRAAPAPRRWSTRTTSARRSPTG